MPRLSARGYARMFETFPGYDVTDEILSSMTWSYEMWGSTYSFSFLGRISDTYIKSPRGFRKSDGKKRQEDKPERSEEFITVPHLKKTCFEKNSKDRHNPSLYNGVTTIRNFILWTGA